MAANPNFNELATTTLNLWCSRNFANAFTGHNPLFFLLRKRGNVQAGGLGIKALEPLMYSDSNGPQLEGVTDAYTQMVPSATTGFTNSEWAWAEKRLSVTIEELLLDQQGSETSRINHLNAIKDLSVKKFLEGLNADIWRAEGAAGADGSARQYLGSILAYLNRGGANTTNGGNTCLLGEQSYSGTNGGAAVGTSPLTKIGNIERNAANGQFWCTPVANPGSTAALTLNNMNYAYNLAVRDTDVPDLIVMNRQNYGDFMAILQGFQRFDKGGLSDAGFESVKFRGADVVMDDHCPAKNTLFINTKYLKLRCASMAPKFELKPDPQRTIVNWNARWVGQITSGHLGRVHSRHANMGN